jgi:transcriptional regulator with XRE-family HTH domain
MYSSVVDPRKRWSGTSNVGPEAASEKGFLAPLVCAFAIGTMGLATPELLASQLEHRTASWPIRVRSAAPDAVSALSVIERSPAEDLARIREILKPTVLELANVFGVSRQAVYDWQAGAQPVSETAKKLSDLAQAADVFAKAGVSVDAKVLRRKIAGGKTLLEIATSGGEVAAAARSLVETLTRENAQRERLKQRFAGRKSLPLAADDVGAPMLAERT